MRRTRFLLSLSFSLLAYLSLTLALFFTPAGSADAGLISIATGTLSGNGAEIANLGEVISAWNVNGGDGGSPTVNGFTFLDTQPSSITIGVNWTAAVQNDATTSAHYSGDMIDIMEDFRATTSGIVDGTVTISNLEIGRRYRAQFTHHQDINSATQRRVQSHFGTSSGPSGSAVEASNNQGYITTVDFVADTATQLFTLRSPVISNRAVLNSVNVSAEVDKLRATVTPNADTYINAGDSTLRNTNFGSSTALAAKFVSTAPYENQTVNRKAYVRFDLSNLELASVPNAKFSLKFSTAGTTQSFNLYGLNDGDVGENWNEATITYNNAPANTNNNAFDPLRTTLLGSFTVNGAAEVGTWISFVGTSLDNFLLADTDGLVTLLLVRTTADVALNTTFYSKEFSISDAPQLTVDVVPEPSTYALGLAGLAGLGLLVWSRRKKLD